MELLLPKLLAVASNCLSLVMSDDFFFLKVAENRESLVGASNTGFWLKL